MNKTQIVGILVCLACACTPRTEGEAPSQPDSGSSEQMKTMEEPSCIVRTDTLRSWDEQIGEMLRISVVNMTNKTFATWIESTDYSFYPKEKLVQKHFSRHVGGFTLMDLVHNTDFHEVSLRRYANRESLIKYILPGNSFVYYVINHKQNKWKNVVIIDVDILTQWLGKRIPDRLLYEFHEFIVR